MEIQFENRRGEVRFFGGGVGDWHILEVEGLGLLPKNCETLTYYGENGQETVKKSLPGRVITLTAEVRGDNRIDRAKIVSRTMRILAEDGVLSVRSFCEKVCDCYLKSCTEGARDGNFRTYVFQFVCDSPYFRSKKRTEIDLFNRIDLLMNGFVIGDGVVLTKRFSGGIINNDADVKVQGCIHVTSGASSGVITITNKTVGASLVLAVAKNTTYTIDLDKRTIEDAGGENCIGILGDDCYMSDFYIDEGKNEIVVTTESGTSLDLNMVYSFYKNYVEATD